MPLFVIRGSQGRSWFASLLRGTGEWMLAHVPRSNTDTESPCHRRVVQYRLVSGRTAPVLFVCRTSTPHFIVCTVYQCDAYGWATHRFASLGSTTSSLKVNSARDRCQYFMTGPVLDASSSCTDPPVDEPCGAATYSNHDGRPALSPSSSRSG